jgi:hypothetical protein
MMAMTREPEGGFESVHKNTPDDLISFKSETVFAGGNKKDLYPRHGCLDKGLVDR